MSTRKLRIEQLIKRTISFTLINEIDCSKHIERMPSISRVELSKDLSYAKIYLLFDNDNIDKKECLLKYLKQSTSFIKKSLSINAHLKYTPKIEFKVDQQMMFLEKLNQTFKINHKDNL